MSRVVRALAIASAALVALLAVTAAGAKDKQGGKRALPRVLMAAVHADVTALDQKGETRQSAWDRGEVTAFSETAITLARKDGKSVTLSLDSSTKVRAKDEAVHVGDMALAVSRAGAAILVLAASKPDASSPAPTAPTTGAPKERERGSGQGVGVPHGAVHVDWALILADGKTATLSYDRGEVTRVSAAALTLQRPDGKSVTLKLDRATKVLAKEKKVAVGDHAAAFSKQGTALIVVAGEKPEKK